MTTYIQTYWNPNRSNLYNAHLSWLAPEYNFMSWSLSCLQLKQFSRNLVLYTDSITAKVLIDVFKLPYTDVICSLDHFNIYHSDLWALPKIYAYAQQEESFLHIDGDVYIWKKLDENFLEGELIAQSLEKAKDQYNNIIRRIEKELTYLPKVIASERLSKQPVYCYNAGIFGGSDREFFKRYCCEAFRTVNKNINALSNINLIDFNIFFEQYLFYCMAKKENKQVNVLIKDVIDDGRYKGLGDFEEVPHNKQYLHLIGNYKRDKNTCLQLANRLRQDYPEYYYRIIHLFKKKQIPLWKDYYYFVVYHREKELLCRYHHLKHDYEDNKF